VPTLLAMSTALAPPSLLLRVFADAIAEASLLPGTMDRTRHRRFLERANGTEWMLC
jgi:hypothetical protein